MANRILRDWTDSDKINSLSVHAERFFTRLIMKADDYGCFYADHRLLKANLFPLLMNEVREADISRWIAECEKAGLIVLYLFNQKQYCQIIDFKQRLRSMKSKFPTYEQCKTHDRQLADNCQRPADSCPPETRNETETKQKVETEREDARGFLVKNFVWYKNQFDEKFLSDIALPHKGKDIQAAILESYVHLSSDKNRLRAAENSDCKRLLNTWLSNQKTNQSKPQKVIHDLS